jgi:hypothetical protein
MGTILQETEDDFQQYIDFFTYSYRADVRARFRLQPRCGNITSNLIGGRMAEESHMLP